MGEPSSLIAPFHASPVACLLIDREWRIEALNAAAARLLQTRETEALGRTLPEVGAGELADDATRAAVLEALETSGSSRVILGTEADGTGRPIEADLIGIPDDTGRHRFSFCFLTALPRQERRRNPEVSAEARFVQLFEHFPEALILQDPDGVVLDANPAAARLYGYDRSELVGKRLSEIVVDLDAGAEAPHRASLEEQGFFVARSRGIRSDGRSFPQEITVARLTLAGRTVATVLARDLTERRRLEARLTNLTELVRLHETGRTLEQLAVRALHLARRAVSADRGVLATFGPHGRVEWLANEGLEGVAEAARGIRATDVPWLSRALRSGQPAFIDRFSRRDDSAVNAIAERLGIRAFTIVPLRSGTELTGVLGLAWSSAAPAIAHDRELLATIGRLLAIALGNVRLRDSLIARERALDESEARYRALFEEAPQAILVESVDGEILDANAAATRLYRRERSELVGRRVQDVALLDEDDRRREMQILARDRRGVFRSRRLRGDGTTFPSEAHIVLGSIDGQERLLVQIRDVTEEERLQAELLQAQKMEALGQLVAGVAHELNNPLAAIIAFSQLMRGDERLPPDLQQDAALLVQEADRTRRIVQNLLEFARQRRPERRTTSLRELLQRTLELQSYSIGAGAISVRVEVPEDLPAVDVDPAQIQQVLLNLTLNAIQSIRSSQRRGEITITASHDPASDGAATGRVRVAVSDNGPGVPEDATSHLFEPFFTTKAVGEGTGLGLSVSYGIVTSHGGRLWHEPRPGGGATFVLELPAADPESSRPTPILPQPGMVFRRHQRPRPRPDAGGDRPPGADASAEPTAAPDDTARATEAAAARPPSDVAGHGDRATAASGVAATLNGARPDRGARPLGAVILAVDDEPSIRAFVHKALSRAGHEVTVAGGGEEALSILERLTFDALLLDHRMSGMDGIELYRRAVEIRPELRNRTILMSGDVVSPALLAFGESEGVRLLGKPFDIDTLTATLAEVIAQA